ncbi:Predicted PurR-regulated permease PerM [Bhargavaea ginsengi]|uniref:Predicted PurR-regulated permease PerM n=1 Tax=Bhargavaea ginsengi TaxID=426757 RepID=A0A1H6WXJ6_9BACL|nr:AI-2E family transporter [Bhargavaea ginsengi]SEJ17192.1 Predicted PurR-regulated permease PerM [Bhargavaea ginsengi]
MEGEKGNPGRSQVIRFLGGRTTLFVLGIILLAGLIVLVFNQIQFVFTPFKVLVQNVVLPVVLASVLFYLLRPVLRLLEKARIPRVWGILIIYVGGIGLISLAIFLIYPFLKTQVINLVREFPEYFRQLILNIDAYLSTSLFASYYNELDVNLDLLIDSVFEDISGFFRDTAGGIASGVTNFISTLTGIVISIVTVPFILFYLLKDGDRLPDYIMKLMPPRMRDDAGEIFGEADQQLSNYIQGQLIVSFCIGLLIYIGFVIIGMDYALALGALAAVTSVVPYLGPVIAITPALIIALVTSPFMILKLAAVWTIVQLVEGKFISPQVMGKTLHIHPITIIFVLLTAGSLFGVPGVILGIPGYALLKVIVSHLFKLFKKRYDEHENNPNMKYQTDSRRIIEKTGRE